MICSHQSQSSKNRKRKIGNNSSSSYNTSSGGSGNGGNEDQKESQGQNTHAGSLWADAESLAADFDGSLSGLGADLSTASYDMSEALLALPSLYHHHRNATAQQMSNTAVGFIKEAGLTPLSAAHLHGGSSVSLPGDFHYENHSSPNCQQISGNGPSQAGLDCERRFQYVLAAATSIATKMNEETLTYLNQGQPYEIKLKKLGDLTSYRGVVFRSVVRLCFHDRRLQFSEREQIAQWEDGHPNDKILQVDLPLSYGMTILPQSSEGPTNLVSFLWEPLKEVGIYVKVNCISTEFTPKKHGGEKGVPFRMMIETFSHPDNVRLHASACQVKVFKLKGADRKHKQDREKILKKTPGEQAKLQPSYECTVLSDVSLESLDSPPPTSTSNNQNHSILSPSYSSDQHAGGDSPENPNSTSRVSEGVVGSSNCNNLSSTSHSNYFSAHFSPESVRRWLIRNRFGATKTLWDFSGLDLLRLSKEELIEMCGLAEGIRLYNALHYKITYYVTLTNFNESSRDMKNGPESTLFHPVCLSSPSIAELTSVLGSIFSTNFQSDCLLAERLFLSVNAPGNVRIRVNLTEQLLSTLKDQTAFKAVKNGVEICLEILE
jgi:transcription factor CP2-like protein